ncbi:hypothetical protein EJ06DRAFT_556455 [Trichodelitschia bisporula]|uniref:Uncharacterized protein n=1 Tax=Trichodelitschia bisporula TaxID=703511 RepID=A0A6G1HYQ3_9PEZI|nr:hypothetical protein EJ06DRAFT_556455 [Trichodelitschia bisporula]
MDGELRAVVLGAVPLPLGAATPTDVAFGSNDGSPDIDSGVGSGDVPVSRGGLPVGEAIPADVSFSGDDGTPDIDPGVGSGDAPVSRGSLPVGEAIPDVAFSSDEGAPDIDSGVGSGDTPVDRGALPIGAAPPVNVVLRTEDRNADSDPGVGSDDTPVSSGALPVGEAIPADVALGNEDGTPDIGPGVESDTPPISGGPAVGVPTAVLFSMPLPVGKGPLAEDGASAVVRLAAAEEALREGIGETPAGIDASGVANGSTPVGDPMPLDGAASLAPEVALGKRGDEGAPDTGRPVLPTDGSGVGSTAVFSGTALPADGATGDVAFGKTGSDEPPDTDPRVSSGAPTDDGSAKGVSAVVFEGILLVDEGPETGDVALRDGRGAPDIEAAGVSGGSSDEETSVAFVGTAALVPDGTSAAEVAFGKGGDEGKPDGNTELDGSTDAGSAVAFGPIPVPSAVGADADVTFGENGEDGEPDTGGNSGAPLSSVALEGATPLAGDGRDVAFSEVEGVSDAGSVALGPEGPVAFVGRVASGMPLDGPEVSSEVGVELSVPLTDGTLVKFAGDAVPRGPLGDGSVTLEVGVAALVTFDGLGIMLAEGSDGAVPTALELAESEVTGVEEILATGLGDSPLLAPAVGTPPNAVLRGSVRVTLPVPCVAGRALSVPFGKGGTGGMEDPAGGLIVVTEAPHELTVIT